MSPSKKNDIPACVCLSECNLPGLIGHSERYGRFGFVFTKKDVFGAGGRPCCYVAEEEYAVLARIGKKRGATGPEKRLFGLANVYRPPGHGQVQDYTHEREWRLFDELRFDKIKPVVLIAPLDFTAKTAALFPGRLDVVPLDLLFNWGA